MESGSMIEINCDMGEGFGRWKMGPDEQLMKHVNVANVACGYHAGDPSIMVNTVRLARKHNIRVGAHPGLPDLIGFGRRRMEINPDDVYAMVLYQVGALAAIITAEGLKLNHVKPHGELYFYLQREPAIMDAVVRAVSTFEVPIYGLPTSQMKQVCQTYGVELIPELYVDIDYDNDGKLVPVARSQTVTPGLIGNRIHNFVLKNEISTLEGKIINGSFGTPFSICIHSDLPGALDNAAAARAAVSDILNQN